MSKRPRRTTWSAVLTVLVGTVTLAVALSALSATQASAGSVGSPPVARLDPGLEQITKVLASDGAPGDNFGYSVAVSGDTAVIGAHLDDNVKGTDAGAAYVFTRTGAMWSQQATLTASGGAADDRLGYSVAVSGDTAVIGAPYDDNDKGTDSGSAYVFTRTGTTWSQVATLTAAGGAVEDLFGWSVAVQGDTAVVGAPYDDNDTRTNSGSAYVFTRSGTTWSQEATLTASGGAMDDNLGRSVAVQGDTALVGAPYDNNDKGTDAGSAYVFTRSGTTWSQEATLTASGGAAYDLCGQSVALSGDAAVIGAPSGGVHGTGSGSACVFARSGATWSQEATLTASGGAALDEFGWSVAVSGGTAVVGAQYDDDKAYNSGSVCVFSRAGTTWGQVAMLTASDGEAWNLFGWSVAVEGDTAVVGARLDDDKGSAYFFGGLPSLVTAEDTPLTVAVRGVLANDTDVDGDSLTATLTTGVSNGALAFAVDGSFTYTPKANWNGTETFRYKAWDDTAYSEPTTVTITVTPVNDPPTAVDHEYSVAANTTLTVTPPGLLVGASDPDADVLTAAKWTDPSHGTATVDVDGGFRYRPTSGFVGTDTFFYMTTDEHGQKASSRTVTITVVPNDPVYRFYNWRTGAHFYTASEAEKNYVLGRHDWSFAYEGVAFRCLGSGGTAKPVYRFYNWRTGAHFYTASEAEKANVLVHYEWPFRDEGIAFWVASGPADGTPVYRFYNWRAGAHFYTASETETFNVLGHTGWPFRYEGIAFYAPR